MNWISIMKNKKFPVILVDILGPEAQWVWPNLCLTLGDGVTAMALKLKKTPGVTAGKTSAYKSAACSYLGTCYAPYINGILYWADNYKELL